MGSKDDDLNQHYGSSYDRGLMGRQRGGMMGGKDDDHDRGPDSTLA